jgi:hypothetical protein
VDPNLDSITNAAGPGSASSSSAKPTAPVVVPPPSNGKGWLGGPESFEASLSVPVFSRRREVFVGRAAMAGFYASCMWEVSATVEVDVVCCRLMVMVTVCLAAALWACRSLEKHQRSLQSLPVPWHAP